ncbi:MAG: polysaccharide deacetylase family protein [Bacteroidota bacterium]
MKKILILSYFFPPSTFAGGYRVYAWAKYFKKFGLFPVIITRKWDKASSGSFKDMARTVGGEVEHVVNEDYEVYYLPYNGSLRDELLIKYADTKFVWFRKFLTAIEQLFQLVTNFVIPFSNIYSFAKELLTNDNNFCFVIATGKPYILFKFAYLLNKKFKIPWVADYRDEWNSSQWTKDYNFFQKLMFPIESYFEKKWVKTASFVTSVSEQWTSSVSAFVHKEGKLVMNGYDSDEYILTDNYLNERFTIVYNGTLYPSQPIEPFVEGFKLFADSVKHKTQALLYFPGLATEEYMAEKVRNLLLGYEDYYMITARMPKKDVISLQMSAHALLMVGHATKKGTHSSKIFEYLACKKPIILCPSDHDVLEQLIIDTKSGFVCNSKEEVFDLLSSLYYGYEDVFPTFKMDEIEKYSREKQVSYLANFINSKLLSFSSINNENSFYNEMALIKEGTSNTRDFIFKSMYKLNVIHAVKSISTTSKSFPVLCFHRISDEKDYVYPPMPVKTFSKIIYYISKNYQVCSLNDIYSDRKIIRPLVITFDDAYSDFTDFALPILEKYQMVSTQSVIADCAEKGIGFWTQELNQILNAIILKHAFFKIKFDNIVFEYKTLRNYNKFSQSLFAFLLSIELEKRIEYINNLKGELKIVNSGIGTMNWDQLKICMKLGVEISNHSATHDSLTTINNYKYLEKEILLSKIIIEEKLDTKIVSFTFPNGQWDKRVLEVCNRADYKYLLTSDDKRQIFENKKIISRISMDKSTYEENIFKLHSFHNMIRKTN